MDEEASHQINGNLIKKSESLKKRVGWWENKGNLEWMRRTMLRKLRIDLADGQNDRIVLKRSVWKRIDMKILMIKKDWHSHRNMRTLLRKGIESTLDIEATRIPQLKTKQRIWLGKLAGNKHMIAILPKVFVMRPHGHEV